jgi:alkanesulfonate monooxygenase SsuD/methylene tetrahydromethanopterin reductase-like flavin-dependent oxidoreductase (luciferase family)
MTDVSLFYPLQPRDPRELLGVATLARRAGLQRLWIGQSLTVETFTGLAFVAGRVPGLALGTGVVLTPLLHPALAASAARSIAVLSGREMFAGFGVSEPAVVGKLGAPGYDRPATFATQYAEAVRELACGRTWVGGSDFPGAEFALPELEAPPVRSGLGVLRPGMARAAGRAADFMITWLAPARYARTVLAATAAESARLADRAAPRLCTVVHLILAESAPEGRRAAIEHVGAHLSRPHYRGMLERAMGVALDDPVPAAVDAVIEGGSVIAGDPGTLAEGVARYVAESGADEVVMNVVPVEGAQGVAFAQIVQEVAVHVMGT